MKTKGASKVVILSVREKSDAVNRVKEGGRKNWVVDY